MWSLLLRAGRWVGGVEPVILASLFVLVVGTWGFISLLDEVVEGDTQAIDEAIVRALRSAENPRVPMGPTWLVESGRDVTGLGGVAVLVLFITAVAGFLLLSGKRRMM